jgi:hypothetical protein
MAAGKYNTYLLWNQYVETVDADNGQAVISFVSNGYLWCAVTETGGFSETSGGAVRTGANCEIAAIDYPEINVKDQLVDEYFGITYHISSIYQGNREMVMDCIYYNTPLVEDES